MKKALLAILVLAVLLVGCAGVQVEKKAPVEKGEVKIGVIVGLTGSIADLVAEIAKGIDLAAADINAAGGINGKELVLVYEDGQCLPEPSATAAQKLISVDKVDAILGSDCSSATEAALPIAADSGTVLFSFASTSPNLAGASPYFFRNVAPDSLQGLEGAKLINDLGFTKVGLLYLNNDYGLAMKDVLVEEIEANGGEVVASESYEQEGTDFRTELTKVKAGSPEVVYIVGYPKECGLILKQGKDLGIDAVWIASEGVYGQDTIDLAGADVAEGLIVTIPAKSDKFDAFNSAFAAKYGEEIGTSPYVAEAYDALMILAKGLEMGGKANLKESIEAIGTYAGVAGTITFDSQHEVQKDYDIVVVKDGEFVSYKDY